MEHLEKTGVIRIAECELFPKCYSHSDRVRYIFDGWRFITKSV